MSAQVVDIDVQYRREVTDVHHERRGEQHVRSDGFLYEAPNLRHSYANRVRVVQKKYSGVFTLFNGVRRIEAAFMQVERDLDALFFRIAVDDARLAAMRLEGLRELFQLPRSVPRLCRSRREGALLRAAADVQHVVREREV